MEPTTLTATAIATLVITKAFEKIGEKLGDKPDVATTLNDLANLYFSQRLDEQAEPLYQQALKIRKQCLGENHPQSISVGESLENLHTAMKNN